jgi:uncharacterized protein
VHGPIPIDWRLIAAVAVLLLAGISKGVVGIGIPVIGVPILVGLYGDLRSVLLATIVATAVADVPLLIRNRKRMRDASVLIGYMATGLIGVVIGTRLLVFLRPQILSGVLAVVTIAFVVLSWTGRTPTIGKAQASRFGPFFGLIAGMLQGAAGASGPVTISYLLSMQLSREGFLFAINAVFFILDWTQLASLVQLGYTPPLLAAAGVALVLSSIGMIVGFAIQSKIDDRLFRRGVLILLACAAGGLIYRVVRG